MFRLLSYSHAVHLDRDDAIATFSDHNSEGRLFPLPKRICRSDTLFSANKRDSEVAMVFDFRASLPQDTLRDCNRPLRQYNFNPPTAEKACPALLSASARSEIHLVPVLKPALITLVLNTFTAGAIALAVGVCFADYDKALHHATLFGLGVGVVLSATQAANAIESNSFRKFFKKAAVTVDILRAQGPHSKMLIDSFFSLIPQATHPKSKELLASLSDVIVAESAKLGDEAP